MIVVSDTTPLNYLVLIEAVDVLPRLFESVYAPTAVIRELSAARTPERVRIWVQSSPAWLVIADPKSRLTSTHHLDDGEAEAISLAKERGITDVLIDDYAGRKVIQAEGLVALPTLAVLERAAELGMIDLPRTIDALRRTTYRVREELLIAALDRDARRKRSSH